MRAMQEREQQRAQQRQDSIRAMGQKMIETDPDFDVSTLPQDMDLGTYRYLSALQKSRKKQVKKEEERAQLPGRAALAAALGPSIRDRGEQGPLLPGQEAVARGRETAAAAGLTGERRLLEAMARQQALGRSPEALGAERVAIRGEGRQTARLRREEFVGLVTSRMADIDLGLATESLSEEQFAGELVRQGFSRSDAYAMVSEARFRRDEMRARRKEQRGGVTAGQQQASLERDAMLRMYQGQWPGHRINPDDVLLEQTGRRAYDPLSEMLGEPRFIHTQSKEEAVKVRDTRRQQGVLVGMLDLAQEAFREMRTAAEEKGIPVGPLLGAGVQDVFAALGMQPAEVARFRNAQFEFVSTLLRARQGSRPSDYDLRMYLALMPLLTETLSPAADAKFGAMKDSLMLSLRAYGEADKYKDILRIKSQDARMVNGRPVYSHPEDIKLERAAQKWMDAADSGDLNAANKAQDEFNRVGAAWARSRGSKFLPPGAEATPGPLPSDLQDAVDRY
jgi:hypothetical protein